MKTLVTGGTGFLGRALALDLAKAHGNDAVVVLVRDPLPEAEREAAEELRAAGIRLVPVDLLAKPALDPGRLSFDVLYHLAAETDSAAPPERLVVNDEGTANLLDTFGEALRGRRVVLAGATAAVDRGRRPKALLREDDPKCPRTAYGRSKLRAEEILADRAARYGFRFAIPRFSPVWDAALTASFLKAFREQVEGGSILRKVGWPGRVTMVRREDAVAVLRHLGETGLADGRAVNVTDGRVYAYRELLRDLREIAGEEKTGFLPFPLWGLVRAFAWLPVVRKAVPWRVSCLIGDDLAADPVRLLAVYPEPFRTWPDSRPEIRLTPRE